ncbi:YicC/YloC family endoribonuclease [Clostridium sp.]|uniref:YicC/YloC family endoribonuclease n=1 Tax=Clostridium sp. TaxID=1506 RepID=UPI00261729F5|nr:YicC/YloC family endoribonuclease [Clostridium sp.]
MIRSMTSFGRAQSDENRELSFSVEMKSVNHRYLDINIRMPRTMLALEEKIRNIVSKKLSRGKIDVFINYKNYGNSAGKVKLNMKLAKEYHECLRQIQKELNVIDDISAVKISRFPDVVTLEETEEDLDETFNEISSLIKSALNSMEEMRCIEGEKLKADILLKIQVIESYVEEIEKLSDVIPKNYKKKLEERLSELLSGIDIDEGRIAQEVAVLSDKAAVDEEITRLRSHLSQMKNTLDLNEPVGRKLDFIIQEMNREANTIASKSTDINITNKVIEVKNTIEKIREQVQNIE